MASTNDAPPGRSPVAVGLLLSFALVAGDAFLVPFDTGTVVAVLFAGGVLAAVWGDDAARAAGTAGMTTAATLVVVGELLAAFGQRAFLVGLVVAGVFLVGWAS